MSRDFPRSRRIEDQIQRILNDVVRVQVRDPRLRGAMITAVKVSRDLGVAWVYYTAFDPGHSRDELDDAFRSALKFLRSQLASQLTVKHVPELRFRYDDLSETSQAMDQLIDDAVSNDADKSTDADDDLQ
ncbi:MAG: 30S ribosome-binding factor RbfA [Gammaproteobacteria bacterium]|jgi:ribosome-binding factor A|nr:ribosome-binding factor A [Chromatiales bacterium]MCP4925415.1 30S ribosome-binding factor RbfA [Gammaproteobacteria bacterium]MDP7153618.1 30S ribosome-binding factor RbfA [Gammaproteobacteria bacterium]MDP7418816.1 30S ribosome-binding factor RbfA [Gammaproteobacteria bacterium]HJP39994.1 30S ribosome-binding factor RbfA [Gammaproteobacteria bacterium]